MAAANTTTNDNMSQVVNAESNSEGSRDSRRVANNYSSKRDDAVAGFARGGGGGGGGGVERIQRRQAAAVRRAEYVEEEEDINEQADEFIKRFREQLHLQRLRSIENYNQMLARGL